MERPPPALAVLAVGYRYSVASEDGLASSLLLYVDETGRIVGLGRDSG